MGTTGRDVHFVSFLFVTFLKKILASLSSAKTRPIMHFCRGMSTMEWTKDVELTTHVTRKGVEEQTILEVFKPLVKLVLPDDTSRSDEVNHAEEERILVVVHDEREGPLEPAIRPRVRVGVCEVDACKRSSLNLACGDDRGLQLIFFVSRES